MFLSLSQFFPIDLPYSHPNRSIFPHHLSHTSTVLFSQKIKPIFSSLEDRAVICDMREPNVLRVAPAPLYNSFSDVFKYVFEESVICVCVCVDVSEACFHEVVNLH